VGIAEEKGLER